MSAGLVADDEIKTFIEDGWIDEVLFPVKSGKEASVYCCRACPGRGQAFFALKVYKSRNNRSFRDAAVYQEGRVIPNARTARAVQNKSRFGRAAEFGAQGGQPAPQLRDVRLSPDEAETLLEQALRNIEIMLSCHVVHGDLSAYNMLYSGGELRVIDLPQ